MESPSCDFVIIGGGTAGLALASRLSEIPEADVTVIETGDNLLSDPRVLTPILWQALLDSPANWAYRTVPQQGLRDRELVCAQGRLLGGCSALNALVFSVNARSNIEAWERLGNPGWDWASFEKNLHKVYTLTTPSSASVDLLGLNHIDKAHDGADGPVKLSWTDEPKDEWPQIWRDTFTNIGYPMVGDPFKGDAHGVFFTAECIDPTTKQRSFVGNAYLKNALDRKNLKVITNAFVKRILLDTTDSHNVIATGVEFSRGGSDVVETIKARKEVIVSGGALRSPEILELSGIGDFNVCKELGVPCIIDNPFVGENLQNHPICGMSFEVDQSCHTMDSLGRQDPEALRLAAEQYSQGRGPLGSSHMFSHCQLPFPGITNSAGKEDLEAILQIPCDIEEKVTPTFRKAHREYVESVLRSENEGSVIHLGISGYAGIGADGSKTANPDKTGKYFTICTLLAHPLSKGSVHADKKSTQGIRIDPRFLTHPVDIEVFARHARRVEELISKTEPFVTKVVPNGKRNQDKYPPGSLSDLATAKEYIKDATFGAYHFTSSCAMMPREHGGVVDSKLRVYGCRNLRVCDASVMPMIPRANPQSTVYAIAEAANEYIRATWYH